MALERVQRAYSALADQYIGLLNGLEDVHPDDLSIIGRHLSIHSGPVLDVGCGPGHMTEYLRTLGVDVSGVDLVPEFIEHARTTYPDGRYELGSMRSLTVPDHSLAGILAWYSLIHVPPEQFDAVLADLRRALAVGGILVVGFFPGDAVAPFDHRVVTAHYWPPDELSARLERAGFTEIERQLRPGVDVSGRRSHGAMAARVGGGPGAAGGVETIG